MMAGPPGMMPSPPPPGPHGMMGPPHLGRYATPSPAPIPLPLYPIKISVAALRSEWFSRCIPPTGIPQGGPGFGGPGSPTAAGGGHMQMGGPPQGGPFAAAGPGGACDGKRDAAAPGRLVRGKLSVVQQFAPCTKGSKGYTADAAPAQALTHCQAVLPHMRPLRSCDSKEKSLTADAPVTLTLSLPLISHPQAVTLASLYSSSVVTTHT